METNQIKVLIGDDTAEYGIKIAAQLREMGLYAFTRREDGNVIFETILKETPDVVVADLSLPNLDAMALINKLKEFPECRTKFIITSQIKNSYFERQAMGNGASFFLVRPFNTETLCSLIKSIAYKNIPEKCNDMEIIVTDIIHKLGVPAHIKGYHYLRTAIIEALINNKLMDCVTKRLYPVVAARYGTTPSRVERAIRHAIDISWSRGKSEELASYFGYTIDTYRGKPTNSEFIALIADRLRIHYKPVIIDDSVIQAKQRLLVH